MGLLDAGGAEEGVTVGRTGVADAVALHVGEAVAVADADVDVDGVLAGDAVVEAAG
ncbi:hypothetical protein [Jatrophihabitans sp.]|uniref:hypothetical protein n=1 Tax=Jatrophihabitans sp. TaxID=1932789 RepID=UPI0038CD1F0D